MLRGSTGQGTAGAGHVEKKQGFSIPPGPISGPVSASWSPCTALDETGSTCIMFTNSTVNIFLLHSVTFEDKTSSCFL